MNKKDITSMADIAKMILENATPDESGNIPVNYAADTAYDKLGQNLRENNYTSVDGKPIVIFYTKKISDEENDVIHNAAGPAVKTADPNTGTYEGPEAKELYFIDGQQVEGPEDPVFINAANKLAATSNKDVQDVFGSADEF